jgi:hypothetical protein
VADDRYHVTQSVDVQNQFLALAAVARGQGRLARLLPAGRWLMEELARTPDEFGESGEYLSHLELSIRRGFPRPLYVEYGVDTKNRIVYLRRFDLVRG